MSDSINSADLPPFPPRKSSQHKGDFGRVLIVAGSRGMSGAAILAGCAALRGGAGLVYVACPDAVVDIVAGYEPCYLTIPLPSDASGRLTSASAERILDGNWDAVAFGPGLGQNDGLRQLAAAIVPVLEAPLVIDADGLNLIVGQLELLRRRRHGTILTPHVGEFARLTGERPEVLVGDESRAKRFAAEWGVVLALKRPEMLVTDGDRVWASGVGNPGMATGGTGDVLTGLTAALLAQGFGPFDAARLGAFLHGSAGDRAAAERGEVSLIARDLLTTLPGVLKAYAERGSRPAEQG